MINQAYEKQGIFSRKIRYYRIILPFTLIELMVVISIIAILAAMLLPALRSAKILALSATCKNNQKQLNLLMQLYANDHDERFPGHYYGYQPSHWFLHLADTSNMTYKAMDKIFSCPGSQPDKNYTVVHGMNVGAMFAQGMHYRPKTKRTNCPEPARTFLSQDGLMDASWLDHFRHKTFRNTGNVSFVDGHVDKFTSDEYGLYWRSYGVTDGGWYNGKNWTAPLILDYW